MVGQSHHPTILSLDAADLRALRDNLRQLRDVEKTLAFQKRREARGKGEPRGANFPGTAERPLQRKQVFAAALKRVNKEEARMARLTARRSLSESAQRALALRKSSAASHHPTAGQTAAEGMRPVESNKRRATIPGSQIGSVSKATKRAQATRDSR
ncbi:hypothetical protein [Microvirga antarctica]|uniref:hypothetical protein n=1 Tax=Microvirga antarctica TaxID=2819233 RepID=UPI0031BB001D